jgi:hypothetical protein
MANDRKESTQPVRTKTTDTGRPPPRKRAKKNTDVDAGINTNQPPRAGRRKLILSEDHGTKTVAVAWRLDEGDVPNASKIRDITFENFTFAPQKAAWKKDGKFIWGWVCVMLLNVR